MKIDQVEEAGRMAREYREFMTARAHAERATAFSLSYGLNTSAMNSQLTGRPVVENDTGSYGRLAVRLKDAVKMYFDEQQEIFEQALRKAGIEP